MTAPPADPKPLPTYFPALTGVRAVAAYLVFWHHQNPFADAPASLTYQLVRQGYLGVSVFFVLSGFLIHHRYAAAARPADGRWWRGYLQNRFARIYPLYAILLTLTVAANWLRHHPPNGWTLIANYTLLKGFFDPLKFSGIGQSWSLTVEECFYLSAPLLFVAVRRVGVWPVTVGLWMAGLGLWMAVGRHTDSGFMAPIPFVLFYTFFGRAFEFLAGIWLSNRWLSGRPSAGGLFAVRQPTTTGLFIIGICVISQALVQQRIGTVNTLVISEFLTYNLLLPVGIVLFFLGLLTENTRLARWLGSPLARAAGVSSYAFYLIHNGIFSQGIIAIIGHRPGVLFLLLIGLGYGFFKLAEQPLQRRLRANPNTP
jgi:peptidoglycan/LPS O-acetylase OafA/YrhL